MSEQVIPISCGEARLPKLVKPARCSTGDRQVVGYNWESYNCVYSAGMFALSITTFSLASFATGGAVLLAGAVLLMQYGNLLHQCT